MTRAHKPYKPRAVRPVMERVMEKVVKDDAGCWLWCGTQTPLGYGVIGIGAKRVDFVHRVTYEDARGPVPEGLELDHLCRVPRCVKPEHLEAVTHAENLRRGRGGWHNAVKTHCPKGHPYSGDNLILDHGKRRCRECVTAQSRARYAPVEVR